jgi:uridine kinase
MFNDYDKNIISIGLYGQSCTGKTMFLRNIINILEIYNKQKYSINNLYSDFTYCQISRNLIRFITSNYYPILVIICTTDDFSNDIFQKIKEIKNTQFINMRKIVILFETIEYTDYFNDFDITFETKYRKVLKLRTFR